MKNFAWVLCAAFALRLTGIGYGLPELYHQDEPILVNHAMAVGVSGGNPHFFIIGSFGIYALFFLFAAYYLFGHLAGLFADTQAFASVFLSDPTPFYLMGRIFLGAVFGTATVWLVYRVGKKLFSERAAFWSALFLAVMPAHVQHSHYIYADIPLTFAVLLMLDALQDLMEKPSGGAYARAGALAGWAMSIKYTALYFLPAALVAHALGWRRSSASAKASLYFGTALLAALGVFAALSPFVFLAWPEFHAQLTVQSGAEHAVGWRHHFVYSLLGGSGFFFMTLAGAGWLAAFGRAARGRVLWTVAGLGYYAVNVYYGQSFARYMMPLLPILALWAGSALASLENAPGRRRALLFLVLLEMLPATLYTDFLFLQPDTRTLCREWVEKNIEPGAAIAVDNRFFAPHLKQTPKQVSRKRDWIGEGPKSAVRRMRLDLELRALEGKKSYEIHMLRPEGVALKPQFLFAGPFLETTPAALEQAGIRYLVLNDSDSPREAKALREALGDRVERLAVFSPYRDKQKIKNDDLFASTAAPHLAPELYSRKRLGPYLEVYRIKK